MLGHKAKDIITGLEGVITAQAEFQFALARYELTPTKPNKDGTFVKPVWLDEPRLKVVNTFMMPTQSVPTVKFGVDVEDKISGFKGIVTGRYTFLNGCIRIEVTPRTLKDGSPVDPEVFDEQRLTAKSKAAPGGDRSWPTPYPKAR
jgi:hypothetical protein